MQCYVFLYILLSVSIEGVKTIGRRFIGVWTQDNIASTTTTVFLVAEVTMEMLFNKEKAKIPLLSSFPICCIFLRSTLEKSSLLAKLSRAPLVICQGLLFARQKPCFTIIAAKRTFSYWR